MTKTVPMPSHLSSSTEQFSYAGNLVKVVQGRLVLMTQLIWFPELQLKVDLLPYALFHASLITLSEFRAMHA